MTIKEIILAEQTSALHRINVDAVHEPSTDPRFNGHTVIWTEDNEWIDVDALAEAVERAIKETGK